MTNLLTDHPFYLVAIFATLMVFFLNLQSYKITRHNKRKKRKEPHI